jgi:TctA family transporter|tara:strand:- start:31325 stop:32857 length:1533 start_codon:yes stop_codon:yes gene_type:complete
MDTFLSIFDSVLLGGSVAFTFSNVLYCAIGVLVGMVVGVLPGIGSMAAMSLLFPITFHIDVTGGLIMLAGIYYGASYGGSTAAILLKLPGSTASVVTCLDGYPMAQQGRAGVALFMTTIASFVGGSIGIVLMMLFSPLIVSFAAQFGDAEFFAMMVLGLVAASTISPDSRLKALSMVVLGIGFGLVGTDLYSGVGRFTFDQLRLAEGFGLVAVAMGLFGVPEVISSIRSAKEKGAGPARVSLRSMLPAKDDWMRSWPAIFRGTGLGAFFGTLPGTGGTVASFMSYATERQLSKEPSRFGKGAIEGVAGPEAANNAADQTSFIPTMTLGIPGSVTMAIILGALLTHGIPPGPRLMTNHPDIFWGLVMSFWLGNLLLLILNLPLIGVWVRILTIPYKYLFPAILVFVCLGVYSINHTVSDIIVVIGFGALGYGMRILKFPAAPMLLGFVLGPMMEEHFRRAMLLSRGSVMTFIERPISLVFLLATIAVVALGMTSAYRQSRLRRRAEAGGNV